MLRTEPCRQAFQTDDVSTRSLPTLAVWRNGATFKHRRASDDMTLFVACRTGQTGYKHILCFAPVGAPLPAGRRKPSPHLCLLLEKICRVRGVLPPMFGRCAHVWTWHGVLGKHMPAAIQLRGEETVPCATRKLSRERPRALWKFSSVVCWSGARQAWSLDVHLLLLSVAILCWWRGGGMACPGKAGVVRLPYSCF